MPLGHLHQALGGIGAPVQDHVLGGCPQISRNLLVHRQLTGIDDAHIHPGPDRVVEEGGMHGFAHRVVAAERERHVADAAAHQGMGKFRLDAPGGFDEGERVVVVFLDTGGDGEDIRVEDDVFGRKPDLVDQQFIGAPANRHSLFGGLRLARLVEGHHHHGGAEAAYLPGLAQKRVLALLEADGVDHALALQAFQACKHHAPPGRIHHHGYPRDVGLRGHEVEKPAHRGFAVQHAFIHVDVDQLGAALHLLAGHAHRFLEIVCSDEPPEARRPVTLVRSPTLTNRLSGPIVKGSSPDRRVRVGSFGRRRDA